MSGTVTVTSSTREVKPARTISPLAGKPADVEESELAGEPIVGKLTRNPGK
jgi:hypothetical protein